MAQATSENQTTFTCKTCGVKFVVLTADTPVCCPVCRMNRLERGG